jgi:hypothetical protein
MFKYGDISILTKLRVVIFVNWNNNSLFPEWWECLTSYTQLKAQDNRRMLTREHPLIIKDGITWASTQLKRLRRYLPNVNSRNRNCGKEVWNNRKSNCRKRFIQTGLKFLAKASALFLASVKIWSQTFNCIKLYSSRSNL